MVVESYTYYYLFMSACVTGVVIDQIFLAKKSQ